MLSELVAKIDQISHTSTTFDQISDDVCCSKCQEISLADYAYALPQFCTIKHKSTCSICPALVNVAQNVLQNGFVLLTDAFRSAFPNVTYHSHSAKHCLLQLPLVALRVGIPESGVAELYVCEYFLAVNYRQFLHILNAFHAEKCSQKITFNKQHFKDLLSIAQNDRERECIRYTAFAVSGLSATGARKHFGLEHMTERAERVQRTIEEAKAIRSAIQSISETQEKVALAEFGIQMSDESDSGTDSDVTEDSDIDLPQHPSITPQDTDLI